MQAGRGRIQLNSSGAQATKQKMGGYSRLVHTLRFCQLVLRAEVAQQQGQHTRLYYYVHTHLHWISTVESLETFGMK
jgi:hypothetical protein